MCEIVSHLSVREKPGPARAIGRAFAFKSSDLSLIQQEGNVLCARGRKARNLDFSRKNFSDEQEKLDKK